ncbi:Periodic tryptophan protein 1 homolog, partial [Gryllus bimaculatus]
MEDLVPAPKINFIPCIRWVKRGVAKENPDKVELTEEELQAVISQTKTEIDENENGEIEVRNGVEDDKGSNGDEFDFAHYDDDDDGAGVNVGNIIVSANTSKDPYITLEEDEDEEDSEREDDIIRPNDNLVLVGHVEGDATVLEVYVYNEEEESLYVHHDVLLPSFPLCIEWLGFEPKSGGAPGNLCAVGTMSPVIEIWDLDLVDCIEAVCKLGRKKSKKKGIKAVGHKDAVLDISWNTIFPHILASGSVDQTVLLWDLDNCLPASKFKSFTEKVQSLKWHPFESQTLLTGCCDGTGYINYIDCRCDEPVWTIYAHTKEVTGLSMSTQCPGLLVSASTEGVMKIWDVTDHPDAKGPKLVNERNLGLGAVHCLEGSPNSPFVFCAGGDQRDNNFKVMDIRYNDVAVEQHFSSRELLCIKTEADDQPSTSEPMDTTCEAAEALQSLSLKGRHKKNKKNNID